MNQRRIEIADLICEGLEDVPGLTLPIVQPGNKHVFHLFPLRIDAIEFGMNKDQFIATMINEHGVKIGTHYIPLHWSTAFQRRGSKRGQFPNAEAIFEQQVTLPMHPRLTNEAVNYLVESIRKCRRR